VTSSVDMFEAAIRKASRYMIKSQLKIIKKENMEIKDFFYIISI